MEPVIEIKNLKTSFMTSNGEVQAVRGISFSVNPGEILGVVGESGSGKSVTSMSILRLLADTAVIKEGSEILFEGENLIHVNKKKLRSIRGEKISMIFQDPMSSINPLIPVGKQVGEMIREHHKDISKEKIRQEVLELFRKVRIPEPEKRYNCYPHEFSGGMRQRVMIAMALACKPDILIADEPTTALDVTIQAQILRLMNDLQKENGTAIMFITHDLGVINEMADDVVVMYCGQVVEQAPARVIFTNCEKSHPYTEGLMYSIPRLNDDRKKLDPIPGAVPHPLDLPKGCKFAPRCKYCTQKCIDAEPELKQVAEGQYVRCFYPDKEERRSAEHGKIVVHY